jgi:hypothetical protein
LVFTSIVNFDTRGNVAGIELRISGTLVDYVKDTTILVQRSNAYITLFVDELFSFSSGLVVGGFYAHSNGAATSNATNSSVQIEDTIVSVTASSPDASVIVAGNAATSNIESTVVAVTSCRFLALRSTLRVTGSLGWNAIALVGAAAASHTITADAVVSASAFMATDCTLLSMMKAHADGDESMSVVGVATSAASKGSGTVADSTFALYRSRIDMNAGQTAASGIAVVGFASAATTLGARLAARNITMLATTSTINITTSSTTMGLATLGVSSGGGGMPSVNAASIVIRALHT